ncbi:MAG: methylenetetrahydrofolate reductase [NAD(P)H] [Lachnospiraceae bacterium]|jgi:methylenetetrahydrofolate reductase (NADPH)|nr:methylenetetrahydrofolate reductase [NAD(P)H] [Lachnospiraceae bacterium]
MKLTEIYNNKDRVLSFEIFPPKAAEELENIDETLEILCDLKPDYISVTFGAGGSSNNNKTIAICRKIREKYHTEAVAHLTCLCYDEKEIDEFCRELQDNGIENILALRGDANPNAPAKGVFAHASDLITYIRPKTDFCIAGACYPENHPDSPDRIAEMAALRKKVEAGAEVLLSQLFFDNEDFFRFVEDARIAGIDVPITPGIMPCLSAKTINRMVTTCGARLPERFKRILDKYGEKKEALFDAGLYYAISQIIDLIATGSDGVHIYTMNNPTAARRICDGIKNII